MAFEKKPYPAWPQAKSASFGSSIIGKTAATAVAEPFVAALSHHAPRATDL